MNPELQTAEPGVRENPIAPPRGVSAGPWQVLLGVALVISTYTMYVPGAPTYDMQRLAQVILLAGGLFGLGLLRPVSLPRLPKVATAALAVAAGASVLAIMLSPVPAIALRHAALAGVFALAILALRTEVAERGTGAAQVGIAMFAVVAYINTLVGISVVGSFGWTWSNPRFLGQVCSWLIPLLLGMAVRESGTRSWPVTGLGVAWVALLVASNSRGAWIAIAGGLVVGAYLAPVARHWLRNAAISLAAGLPLGFVLQAALGGGRPLSRLLGDSGRLDLWVRTWDLWTERPLFGLGPGALSVIGQPPAHPHNAPLQLLAEWGAVGVLAMVVATVIILRRHPVRTLRQNVQQSNFRAGAATALVTATAHSLVSGIVVTPVSQLFLVLVAGIVLAPAVVPPAPRPVRRGMAAVAVAVAVTLVATTLATWPSSDVEDRRHPRFWLVSPDEFRPLDAD